MGIFGSPWTSEYGFGNFIELFRTPDFSQAIWNTLYFNAVNLREDGNFPFVLNPYMPARSWWDQKHVAFLDKKKRFLGGFAVA